MTEREEKILDMSEELFDEMFEARLPAMERYIEEHSKEVVGELISALEKVLRQVEMQQNQGEKMPIAYLVFSYLYSGMELKRKRIRIDAMDQRFYADITESAIYLDLDCFYQFYEKDLELIKANINKYFPRIYEYEFVTVRQEYAMYYHEVVQQFLEDLLESSDEEILFDGIKTADTVVALFGSYMDQADVICKWGGT